MSQPPDEPHSSPPPPEGSPAPSPGFARGSAQDSAPGSSPGPSPDRSPGPLTWPPPTPPAAGLPGWAWPVIAALALAVGLVGGVLGGVAVSTSLSPEPVPTIDTSEGIDGAGTAALPAGNASIAAVAAKVLPSTVQVQANGGADGAGEGGTGSGFVLDDKDHVVTNNHVVADALGPGQLVVVDRDGRDHAAKIVGRSPVYDLAVLEVADATGLRPATMAASRGLRVGDTVVALGSPLGLSSTVTSGIVSATDRPVTTGDSSSSASFINALQTDAAINPGNSGGPLVDLRGRVVGVNSAIASTGGAFGGQAGNIGVGFAIPAEQVRVTTTQILTTGRARYPVIGADVRPDNGRNGAELTQVPSGSPAARAGLQKGDVVTGINGRPVSDGIDLIVAIRSHQPGEAVELEVRHDGRRRHVRVVLSSKVG